MWVDDILPPMPCPLCHDCGHDIRGVVLELSENVTSNARTAFHALLDGIESETAGAEEFGRALTDLEFLRHQIDLVMEAVPMIAAVKATHVRP